MGANDITNGRKDNVSTTSGNCKEESRCKDGGDDDNIVGGKSKLTAFSTTKSSASTDEWPYPRKYMITMHKSKHLEGLFGIMDCRVDFVLHRKLESYAKNGDFDATSQ